MQLSQVLAGGNGQLALHCQLAEQHLYFSFCLTQLPPQHPSLPLHQSSLHQSASASTDLNCLLMFASPLPPSCISQHSFCLTQLPPQHPSLPLHQSASANTNANCVIVCVCSFPPSPSPPCSCSNQHSFCLTQLPPQHPPASVITALSASVRTDIERLPVWHGLPLPQSSVMGSAPADIDVGLCEM